MAVWPGAWPLSSQCWECHRLHAVALLHQRGGQKLELAGEVLVDEEDVHTVPTP